jgi:hypothetical protein
MGFGAGMGLSNIKNCTDGMHLDSVPGTGTRLSAMIFLRADQGEGEANHDSERDPASAVSDA